MSDPRTFAALLVFAVSSAFGQSPPPEATQDAELTHVLFTDADTGWAVGDRGVIWHTIDGGRHWQRQDSPTRSRLESVAFIDADNGWAVGGHHQPHTHGSVGVVLRTVDGGKTWQVITGLNLPALKYVKFFSLRQGIAVGDSSAMYPGGIFTTADGGRSWASLPMLKTADEGQVVNCIGGDFSSLQGGLVARANGEVATITGLDVQAGSRVARLRPAELCLSRNGTAWLAGQGNALARSTDGGATWHEISPVAQAAGEFDFAAIATVGNHCWVAGNPGSLLFHSADEGKTWEAYRTGVKVPLNSLYFFDENRGWAVGALGTILATRDGGRTWRAQRQAGTRLAMLAVFSRADRLPHEMIVQQAGNEGYLTGIEVLTPPSSDPTHEARLQQSSSTLLASHASTAPFVVDEIQAGGTLEQILAAWKLDGVHALEEHVVRRIRTWRPDVIVTEDAHPRGDNPLAHLTNQIVLTAATKAADPAEYSYQIAAQGLEAWKARKVFAALPADRQGDIKLVCSQLAPRLGASLADVADEARAQLEEAYTISPATRGFNLLLDHLPQGQGKRDFFSGMAIAPGGDARRVLSNPPVPDFALLTRQIQKRQALHEFLLRSETDALRGTAWLAQMSEMTKGLTPMATGRVMHHVAHRYQAAGESELAAEVFHAIIEKHPNHPLSDASLLWLLHYYTSAEAAQQLQASTADATRAAGLRSGLDATRASSGDKEMEDSVALVAAQSDIPPARTEEAIALGKLLEKNRTVLFADPSVRFALAVAQQGQAPSAVNERQRLLQSLASSQSCGVWSQCAQAELWLAGQERGNCPKPRIVCKRVKAKPRLDGRLDDAVWQSAQSVALRESNAEELPATAIAIARDGEFLYLAVSCRREPSVEYAAETRVRQRDSDISRNDRIELMIDINRDYASYYRLAIDSRGWTNDSCYGNRAWDPTWYVAASGDTSFWTAEAAIPLAELTLTKELGQQAWSVGLQRIVPARGLQSWTMPADLNGIPAAFGLMQFE
jgi:photosystem II stability/assembly factor-like uncharacterized protein